MPTTLSPDGRSRPATLRTWRDGWRTLRFFLLYSPRWLFLYPGIALVVLGGLLGRGCCRRAANGRQRHVRCAATLAVAAAAFVLAGISEHLFRRCSRNCSRFRMGLHPPDPRSTDFSAISRWKLGLGVGAVLSVGGLVASLMAVAGWGLKHFGPLGLLAHHAHRDSRGDAADAGRADRSSRFLLERAAECRARRERLQPSSTAFADNYDECLNDALPASGETKEFFARARVEWLAQVSSRSARATGARSADYGCGTGDTTAFLSSESLGSQSVIGLDVSTQFAGAGSRRQRHGGMHAF